MYIRSKDEPERTAIKSKSSDLLNADKINSLGCFSLVLFDGEVREVETVCVETGLCRVFSSGKIDTTPFCMASYILSCDGEKYDSDYFYMDIENKNPA